MKEYKLNGEIWAIEEDQEEEFLSKNPSAVLVSDSSTATATTTDPSTTPETTQEVDISGPIIATVDGEEWSINRNQLEEFKEKFGEQIKWKDPRQVENRFNHITEAQYLDVADEGFGFLWLEGREEKMQALLEKNYKYDNEGNLSGLKFKQRGAGNNIEVILPGNETGRYFELTGVGAGGGEQSGFLGIGSGKEYAHFKTQYVDLVEYIEDRSSNRPEGVALVPEAKGRIRNAFSEGHFGDFLLGWDDDNVAESLTNIDLKIGQENITFEAEKAWDQAIRVTLPNGTDQLFYIEGNTSTGDYGKEASEKIIRFIESNPRSYEHTSAYNTELNKINEALDPIFEKILELDPESGVEEVYGQVAKGEFKEKMKMELNIGGLRNFFQDNRKFKNLTSDQQDRLMDQRISELVDLTFGNLKKADTKKEKEDLLKNGEVTDETKISEHVSDNYRASISGYALTIFNLSEKLNNPGLSETDRNDLYDKLNKVRTLKNSDLNEANFVIDPITMQRTLTVDNDLVISYSTDVSTEGATQIDLEEETERKAIELDKQTLTREELKGRWVETHLADYEFDDKWNNDLHTFELISSVGGTMAAEFSGLEWWTEQTDQTRRGTKYYVKATDAWARKYGGDFLVGLNNNTAHMSRMDYGLDLKSTVRAYDKIYAQNESIITSEKQNLVQAFGSHFIRGIAGPDYDFNYGKVASEQREVMAEVYDEIGITLSSNEKQHVKTSGWEHTGAALSGLPEMVIDFAIGNKALAAVGVTKFITSIVRHLNKARYLIPGYKVMSKSKLLNKIRGASEKTIVKGSKGQEVKFLYKGKHSLGAANSADEAATMAVYLDDVGGVIKGASLINRGSTIVVNSLFEGVKMELAMQSPFTRITGMGDVNKLPGLGESFATGVGFGAMNGILPWTKLWTGLGGKKAGIGKGIYDYTVAAPVNFLAGATVGGFADALVQDFLGNKTWNNFMEDHYGDSDELSKHIITELITGLALRMGHFKKFDFASEGKLQKFKNDQQDKKAELYKGKWVEGEKIEKESTVEETKRKEGKKEDKDEGPWEEVTFGRKRYEYEKNEKGEPILKEGKTVMDLEKLDDLISLSDMRLMDIRDTRKYLDPVAGNLKFLNDFKNPLTKEQLSRVRFRHDTKQQERGDVNLVKPGGEFKYNLKSDGTPKTNNTKKNLYEVTWNPKLLNPGLAPHELLHVLHYEKFGEDVMFKSDWVNGMMEVAKGIRFGDGRTLYQAMEEGGVWKDKYGHDIQRVKEQELFGYIAEKLADKDNYEALVKSYGFDKLADFLGNSTRKNFGIEGEFNTQKEVVSWFLKYAQTMKQGKSTKHHMKHLEKFVHRGKTKKQRQLREQWEALHGPMEGTQASKVLDLKKRIVDKEKELKINPALQQYNDKEITIEEYKEKTKKIQNDLNIMRENLKNIPPDVVKGETKEGKVINDFARKDGKRMDEAEWNAKGGGKEKAINELYDFENGAFVKLINKGISFPIEGRSRETWVEDVSFGIEGKGRKDKATGEDVTTFVSKGIKGIIERFKPEENESLSAWVNSEYQFRRGEIFNWYEKNPIAKPIDAPAGKGKTVGDRLIADKDLRMETFENEDLTKEWVSNKRGEFKEIAKIEGKRDVIQELPVDKKVFEEKGGWQETVRKNSPKRVELKDKGYKDIEDLASEFTEDMYSIKLTEKQRDNLNDIGGETNRKNGQEFVRGEFYDKVMEEGVGEKGELEKRQKIVDGEPVTKKIKNSQRQADLLPDGTVKFDLGVSDILVGRSAFRRLGTMGELYHLATPKNYTRAELSRLGFETNETPHKDGHWRTATGPGGRIYIKGKVKGKKLTGKDVERFVGVKEDGNLTSLKEDRSIGGKLRRLMTEEGRAVTIDVMLKSSDLTANIVANLKGGSSRSYNSKVLELQDAYSKGKFLEEVRSPEFIEAYLDNMTRKKDGTYTAKAVKGVNNLKQALEKTIVRHFQSYKNTDKKFSISEADLKKISDQLYKEFKFSVRVTPEVIAAKAEKAVKLPSSTAGVESKYGLKTLELKEVFNNKDDIVDGQVFDRSLARRLTEKHGVGAYEVFLQDGTSSGGGIGMFKTIEDMLTEGPTKTNRYSIWRSRNINKSKRSEMDSYDMIESVYAEIAREKGVKVEDLKKYEDMTSSESYRQGDKKKLMKIIGLIEAGKFNEANAKIEYEHGERNKKVLKEAIEFVRESYENGDISYRTVRQWTEMHAGNMFGLIKKSASLAVLPNGTVKELMKEFGSDPKKWVLEHMTPANHVKARIYDYILSGGEKSMKEAMDLTLRDYHTTFIPKTYDTMVNKILQADLPSAHLPGMDPLQARYYDAAHSSDFSLGLKAFAGHRAGTVYDLHPNLSIKQKQQKGKEVGELTRKLFPERFRKGTSSLNSKNLEHLSNIDKALAEGRKGKKERKGMSTWDFDDTLATTKSGVRARVPNTSGLPKPSRKVVFLAGGAGSGKGNVIKKLGLEKQGFKTVNQDISLEWLKKNNGLPENMNDLTKEQRSTLGTLGHQARGIAKRKMMKYQGNAEGVVVDGTGGSIKAMEGLVKEFKDKGYDVSMLFVETSLKTALERNKARKERSLLDKMVEKNHEAVQGNKLGFKTMFGERFMEVKTDKLKQEDAMPEDLVGKMNDFVSGYEKIRLDAEQFASEGKNILDKGGEFDFTEFDVVTKGEKGPFFQKALDRAKKFGTKHQYILTARPPEAQIAIHEFLKAQGLDIPMENIKALGNSTAEAKALWMVEKAAEGYNDFYFADDAIQNVKAVKDVLGKLDVKSKVVQAKSSNEVKDVDRLDSPDTFSNILHSKDLRLEYEKTISKHRPDLVKEGLVSKSVDEMLDFVNKLDVPINKRKKYQRITTKWLATSNIKLREDGYKVKDAVELAEKYKEDIFSYKNPNGIIEKYAGKVKAKPTNPKTTKEFAKGTITNKKHGITEHVVADTKEGQLAVRKVMDTHFGEKSNPWCLAQKKNGKLTEESWEAWTRYSEGPKSLVFKDGKLIGFKANEQYWDRMDNATDAPVVRIKEGRVTKTVELVPIGGGKVSEFVMETRTTSKDKKTVTTEYNVERSLDPTGFDFHPAGTKIVENKVNGITIRETNYKPNGKTRRVTEFENGKEIESRSFMPDGKTTMSINRRLNKNQKLEHGDFIGHEIRDGKVDLWFGETLINGKVTEIGFKTPRDFEVMDIMKRVDGNLRVDLNKLRNIDPDVKGLPKEVVKPEGMRAIESVKEVLNQLDVKSEVQQTRSLNSKNLSLEFNKILEEVKGVGAKKTFSEAKGKLVGKKVWNVPIIKGYGAEDFAGLVTYAFAGKGKKGEAHKKFFEDNLQKPFNRAYNDIHARKQNISVDYKALRKEFKDVTRILNKEADGIYTIDQAIRVHLWDKAGMEIPGLSKADTKALTDFVRKDSRLVAFAENLSKITMLKEGYLKPVDYWLGENITTDMNNVVDRIYRKEALSEFTENREAIFGTWKGGKLVGDNMNKIESAYGPKHREALENILWRMEKGTNRTVGADSNTNRWMNWVNSATGTIMFFNQKSAVLQTISSLNYVNGTFNNPMRAAQAFANQPQYWKDFVKIFGSDMMVQRRSGLKINIEAAELIDRVGSGDGAFSRFRAYLLEKGFIPTKYADSFAIASGGATFYRNSIRKHIKNGMSKVEAEKRAWEDFTEMTEATQQSSRPDLISMQQASALGRPILAFANTPMQMFRRHKRRIQDIASGRGNTAENITSALYYGFAQTLIFSFLSNAMFAIDDEPNFPVQGMRAGEVDPDADAKTDFAEKKKSRFVNTVADSYLRGMGTGGAGVAALKNGLLSFMTESEKDHRADYGNTVIDMLNVSPPIGSKARKLYSALKTYKYNKEVIPEMGLDFDNPAVMSIANVISAITNIPTDRAVMKINNIRDASMGDFETWQRISMFMGWNKWQLGVGEKSPSEIRVKEVDTKLKEEKKTKKKQEKKEEKIEIDKEKENKNRKKKDGGCIAVSRSGNRCKNKAESGGYCTIHQKVDQRKDGKKSQCKKMKQISKKKKERCKVQTSNKSGYCYYHD